MATVDLEESTLTRHVCPECGEWYDPELPNTVKAHRLFHEHVLKGYRASKMKGEKVVWEEGKDRITVVDKGSTKAECRRAFRVADLAYRRDMRVNHGISWDFPSLDLYEPLEPDKDMSVFLLHEEPFIVGLCILERMKPWGFLRWEDFDKPRERPCSAEDLLSPLPDPTMEYVWQLRDLWIHTRLRGMGLSTLLLNTAMRHLGIKHMGVDTFKDKAEASYCRHLWPDGVIITNYPDVRY